MRRGLRVSMVVVGLAVAAAPLRDASAQAPQRRTDFSKSERAKLRAGKLITRPVEERRGRRKLFGGTSWQVVDLSPEAVWRALHDVKRYRKMLPQVSTSREVGRQGSVRTAYIEHGQGAIDASYYVNLRYSSAKHDVFFQLDRSRPSSIRSAWGFLRVTPWEGGRALLSFGVMADMGDGLVNDVVRPRIHKWMLRVPKTFKKYIEGKGRERYDSGAG